MCSLVIERAEELCRPPVVALILNTPILLEAFLTFARKNSFGPSCASNGPYTAHIYNKVKVDPYGKNKVFGQLVTVSELMLKGLNLFVKGICYGNDVT